MTEATKAEIKQALAVRYSPNNDKFRALYGELLNALTEHILDKVHEIDLMEIEGLKSRRESIIMIDNLLADAITERSLARVYNYPLSDPAGGIIMMRVTFEKE